MIYGLVVIAIICAWLLYELTQPVTEEDLIADALDRIGQLKAKKLAAKIAGHKYPLFLVCKIKYRQSAFTKARMSYRVRRYGEETRNRSLR